MCTSYKGFGRVSIAAGLFFAAAGFFVGFNPLRIGIVAFFLILGAVDLSFYSKYGDHS